MPPKKVIFWFRRDLRLADNIGLYRALKSGHPVIPLFIFDREILDQLKDKDDRRVTFLHQTLQNMQEAIRGFGSDLIVHFGHPIDIWQQLIKTYDIAAVFTNRDYEPYAIQRDQKIAAMLKESNISFYDYKDQVVFEKDEILTDKGKPYTVYTPYRRRWEQRLASSTLEDAPSETMLMKLADIPHRPIPTLSDMGFIKAEHSFPDNQLKEDVVRVYDKKRNFPGIKGTTYLGLHLRFGTVSVRNMVRKALTLNDTWLSELIWREFFMMILWHFPHVVGQPFKEKYAAIPWRQAKDDFQRWCDGRTGYPIVDAGMRELNQTGFMHNRVRMVTASFLTKHLLLDWRWGEAYFARKLLDFDLSANNGNWQWAAGCGCDAAPYFRIFNPYTQTEKFDPDLTYVKKWVPEMDDTSYPTPMVNHKFARERALETYKKALHP